MSNAEQPANALASAAGSGPDKPRRRSSLEVWMLGIFSVIGIVGFLATLVLILMRAGDSQNLLSRPVMRMPLQGAQGERGPSGPIGPAGPMGPAGPAGDPGIRIVRPDCPTGTCNLECNEDEILLIAHCGTGRLPTLYTSERGALCRSSVRAPAAVVAACVKTSRRQP